MQKIDRTELADFLNTTPAGTTPTWAIIGVGVTDKSTDYNANVTEEKWIINKNANKEVEGYALSSGIEQTTYKGDKVFEFIDDIKFKLKVGPDAQTQLLEVFKYDVDESGATPKYKARLWNVAISIENQGGETSKISYTINYNGDPTFGTVTFVDGVPTFTADA